MTTPIHYLASQFDLQTRLFQNVTAQVNDGLATTRLNPNTNHLAWLVGHTVSTRFMLANVLGLGMQEPFPALFENGKGLDAAAQYPSLADLTKDWASVSEKISAALKALPAEALGQTLPQPVPTGNTLGDFIAFLNHHEAYSIGQMGIMRKFHGLEAMKYN
jgi:hypothetical protein